MERVAELQLKETKELQESKDLLLYVLFNLFNVIFVLLLLTSFVIIREMITLKICLGAN